MSFNRVSPRGILRDTMKVLIGTVLGILLARSFLRIDHPANSCSPLNLNKRTLLQQDALPKKSHDCCKKCGLINASVDTMDVSRSKRTEPGKEYVKSAPSPDNHANVVAQVPVEVGERPKTLQQEIGASMRKPLFVGVVTAEKLLQTRAMAVNGTWGKKASKLAFFSSKGRSDFGLPVVSLPGVDDTYPPQKKVFRMLKYMHDNFINDYNWFMRVDDDIYVRVEKLTDFLSQLDPSRELYMGQPGMGKPEDLERIQLHANEHYCMGGPGVIYSRALLKKLAPHLDDCLVKVVSYNEDLEVGRCISRRLGVQCTWNYQVSGRSNAPTFNMCILIYSIED